MAMHLIKIFNFLAFQTSSCFQYAVNSESEDSEQETENESILSPKVMYTLLRSLLIYI